MSNSRIEGCGVQGLKMAQSVTDAKPDLGHTDKLPSSIAYPAKTWVRWQK